MRISMSLVVAAAVMAFGAAARAQAPMEPYETTETVAEPAPIAPAQAPAQIPVQQPIDPYSAYPAPPAYGYQAPAAGPPATPSPPSYQQGYYLYPAQGQAPVYYAPPPGGCCCCCQQQRTCGYRMAPRLVRKKVWDGARRFSSARTSASSRSISRSATTRSRSAAPASSCGSARPGRWGFEASQSFLHGSYWNGRLAA